MALQTATMAATGRTCGAGAIVAIAGAGLANAATGAILGGYGRVNGDAINNGVSARFNANPRHMHWPATRQASMDVATTGASKQGYASLGENSCAAPPAPADGCNMRNWLMMIRQAVTLTSTR